MDNTQKKYLIIGIASIISIIIIIITIVVQVNASCSTGSNSCPECEECEECDNDSTFPNVTQYARYDEPYTDYYPDLVSYDVLTMGSSGVDTLLQNNVPIVVSNSLTDLCSDASKTRMGAWVDDSSCDSGKRCEVGRMYMKTDDSEYCQNATMYQFRTLMGYPYVDP